MGGPGKGWRDGTKAFKTADEKEQIVLSVLRGEVTQVDGYTFDTSADGAWVSTARSRLEHGCSATTG